MYTKPLARKDCSTLFLFVVFILLHYAFSASAQTRSTLSFNSNDPELNAAFDWAKNHALSLAHSANDPVGYWYEAALPNREAFCMRDVSHQAIGAEILGLGGHNLNMFLHFAKNISAEKDFCSYWEINRYNLPAPVDYSNDQDFWYNLPANFDVIFNAYRLYQWTGNTAYLKHPDFMRFYALSMNEYVKHWELGSDKVLSRNRALHTSTTTNRFGINRGIPTYNEGGRGETLLGIDMTASLAAAYQAYAMLLKQSGDKAKAAIFAKKAQQELQFLDDFWWDKKLNAYRSVWYADRTFDYFMVGKDQAFLHYLFYFNAISDPKKIASLLAEYQAHYPQLIVELKTYLPMVFYDQGQTKVANDMVIELCSPANKRRDYPENAYTIIEDITRGLMGIQVNAAEGSFATLSRLEKASDWAELKQVPLLSNQVSVKHIGQQKTTASNEKGPNLKWMAQIPGSHSFLFVNGMKKKCRSSKITGQNYSYITLDLPLGKTVTVSIE